MNLDKKHYLMLALVLGLLATLGSIRVSYRKQIEQLTTEKKTLSDSLAIQRTENSAMTKDAETAEEVRPIQMPNGQIAYITTRTSKTVETVMRQATEQMAQLRTQVSELQVKLSSKTDVVVKAAPFWNVVAAWEPIGQAYYAGGGINLGPISVTVENPVALELRPRLAAMILF